MTTNTVQPARGTRDFLPADVRRREHVIRVVRGVYERYGFEPLETPAFENIETLLGKYGDEGNKLIFKILRRGEHEASGEADLALRYDLTVPLARVVAQYQNELPKFFKRYQIQPVWRADRPARGRFREFVQCDIDAIGSASSIVEAEQLAAVSEVLKTLGFNDFVIRLNHRGVLSPVLNRLFNVREHAHAEALIALDKWDKVGAEGVADEMERRGVASRDQARAALEGLKRALEPSKGDPSAALEGLRRALEPSIADADNLSAALGGLRRAEPKDVSSETRDVSDVVHRGPLDELQEIIDLCQGTPAANHLRFDPFLARGLSYYTGAIMEIAVPDLAGSLGGGGRYDNLIGMFLGRDVPACGFSLGLERIIVVMTERRMFPDAMEHGAVDVMVTLWNDESRADALALAADLRRAGLRVDVYPEADKLGKQFKYASSRHMPCVAIVGDDERARGEVTIKDLRSGTQQSVARTDTAAHVVEILNRPNLEP